MEPVAWACWPDDADPTKDKPQICDYEPLAYRQRVPLCAIPVGWKVVPPRATSKMLDAAYEAHDKFEDAETGAWCGLSSAYKAMIEAAPLPLNAAVTGLAPERDDAVVANCEVPGSGRSTPR